MKRRSAFTLIELLVVVAIIAVLIAILLPSLAKARESARRAACAANLHGYAIAIQAYITDFNRPLLTAAPFSGSSYPSIFWLYNSNAASYTANGKGQISFEGMSPYLGGVTMSTTPANVLISKVWFCPSAGAAQPGSTSDAATYGFIQTNYSYYAGYQSNPLRATASQPDDLFGISARPSQVLMADTLYRWNNTGSSGSGRWDFNHANSGATANHQIGPFVTGNPPFTGLNELFGDFHVSWKGRAEFVNASGIDTTSGNPNPLVNGSGGDLTFY